MSEPLSVKECVWRAVLDDRQNTPCGHKHRTRKAAIKCGHQWRGGAYRVQSRDIPLGDWETEYHWP